MKLITKELERAFEKQGETGHLTREEIPVICKLFMPFGGHTWYLYERDKENPDLFWAYANLGDPMMAECGLISLSELQSITYPGGHPRVERDRSFRIGEYNLKEVVNKIQDGGHI